MYTFSGQKWFNSEPVGSLDDLGGKVVLVKFWTFMCSDCRQSIPVFEEFYKDNEGKKFEIIGVHSPETTFEKDVDELEKQIKELGITFPVVHDPEEKTWQAFDAKNWPDYFIFDKEGKQKGRFTGPGQEEKVLDKLRELL